MNKSILFFKTTFPVAATTIMLVMLMIIGITWYQLDG